MATNIIPIITEKIKPKLKENNFPIAFITKDTAYADKNWNNKEK